MKDSTDINVVFLGLDKNLLCFHALRFTVLLNIV